MKEKEVKKIVKKRYSEVAKKTSCCGGSTCGSISDEEKSILSLMPISVSAVVIQLHLQIYKMEMLF